MEVEGPPPDKSQESTSEPAITSLRIGEIANDAMRNLYAYWRGCAAEGRALRREQLELERIAPHLSRVLLAEVIDEGRDLVVRVAGEEIESRFGGSMRGFRMSILFSGLPPISTAHQWFDIIADGRPRYRRGPMPYAPDRYFLTECLLLPLLDASGAVSHVLNTTFYLSEAKRSLSVPVIDAVVVD